MGKFRARTRATMSDQDHADAIAQYRIALLNSKKEQASVDALNQKLRELRRQYDKTEDDLKIHASKVSKHGEIDYESCAKLAEGFNGADLRNVCTEAGMFAIRAGRGYTINDDFSKATRKLLESKKLESSKHDYKKL